MRYVFSVIFYLILFTASCKKTNTHQAIQEGTYVGTFQRLTALGGQISNVTIRFSSNNWTGQSQFAKYPALCHGTYKVSTAGKIIFENACPWSAEFDWTLILANEYNLEIAGNSIEISRNYSGTDKDIYKLTKQ